jgi:ParB family chromosome partitioning protein
MADHLSVRDTEALARQLNASHTRESPRGAPDPDVERLEDAFRQALGTRVRLVKGRRGGRLVITFFSDEELQGIYDLINRGRS